MLHLIPKGLHRLLYRLAHRVRRWFRHTFKLPIFGVNAVLHDEQGRILLVRHSYGITSWTLPGGGHGRREDPADAVRREIMEELKLGIEALELVATIEERLSGAPHTSSLFAGVAVGRPDPDAREVVAAQFFALEALPQPIAPAVEPRLALLRAFQDRQKETDQSSDS